MDDHVDIEGVTYISSKRAASEYGYTTDYIGQMARAGRVRAKLIGRSWYVLEDDVREKRKGKKKIAERERAAEVLQKQEPPQVTSLGATDGVVPMKAEVPENNKLEPIDNTATLQHQITSNRESNGASKVIEKFAFTRAPTSFEIQRKRRQDALLAQMDVTYDQGEALHYDEKQALFVSPERNAEIQESEVVSSEATSIAEKTLEVNVSGGSEVQINVQERVLSERDLEDQNQEIVQTRKRKKPQPKEAASNVYEHNVGTGQVSDEQQSSFNPLLRFGLAFTMLTLAVMGTVALSFLEKKSFVENSVDGKNAPSVSYEFNPVRPQELLATPAEL